MIHCDKDCCCRDPRLGAADHRAAYGPHADHVRPGTFADTSRPKYSTIEVELVIHGAHNTSKTIRPRSPDGWPGRFRVSDGMILTIDLDLDVTG